MGGVLTVIGRELSDGELSRVTELVATLGDERESFRRLTDVPTGLAHEAVEFHVSGALDASLLAGLRLLADARGLDIAYQDEPRRLDQLKVAVFDMDSTLIECEVIDELAKLAGVGERVAQVTERAMRGELDFAQSFRERVALLAGLPAEQAAAIAERLPISPGARSLIQTLRRAGCHTAICSGGFTLYARRLQEVLGIDSIYANELEVADGRVTGRVVGEIVDGEAKAARLRSLAVACGASPAETMAVGDGANDIPMMWASGLGVAYHAKPKVREQAPVALNHAGLDAILHVLGVPESAFSRAPAAGIPSRG